MAALESLIRAGLPPALSGTAWTGDSCPAGHWLMPAGTRVYRYDIPAKIHTPCAIFYLDKPSQPYDGKCQGGDEIWWLFAAVDLLWDRDLTTVETQQLRTTLKNVCTAPLGGTVPAPQQDPRARLSTAAAAGVPGLQVMAIKDIICDAQKTNTGHTELNLTFTVLATGVPPLPVS